MNHAPVCRTCARVSGGGGANDGSDASIGRLQRRSFHMSPSGFSPSRARAALMGFFKKSCATRSFKCQVSALSQQGRPCDWMKGAGWRREGNSEGDKTTLWYGMSYFSASDA